MNLMFDLSGKVAFASGASHGLGMAFAKGLWKAGASLIINGRSSSKLLKATKSYRNEGLEVSWYEFEVNEEEVKHHVKLMESEVGPIGILVNNAAIIRRTSAKRWGQAEELQSAAVFLSSAASNFVNGHVLYVDGGILATLGSHGGEP